jgi:phosphoribosylaminoimidazole-succinocarboxamide synthase
MNSAQLLHRGSVKDIYLGRNAEELLFLFSDRYSVFDWGEMPDLLENKGVALAAMGNLFFSLLGTPSTWQNWKAGIGLNNEEEMLLKELKQTGLKHHCLGLDEEHPTGLRVKRVEVHEPDFIKGKYDYKKYGKSPVNSLVPLEVVFRFGVPSGSSLLERIGDIDYRRVLGLVEEPIAGDTFARPIIEYSTKLESTDRYLKYNEAQSISGLSDYEFSKLHSLTSLVALRLKSLFNETGIDLWDGKFEYAFGETRELGRREFLLVDSIGPDELRLVKNDQKLSKEFLRGFYRDSVWLEKMASAKSIATERGSREWKDILVTELGVTPSTLSNEYLEIANAMYPSLANHLCLHFGEKSPFKDALSLEELESLMRKCVL